MTRPLARRALEAVVARKLLGGMFGPGGSGGGPGEGPDIIEGEVL